MSKTATTSPITPAQRGDRDARYALSPQAFSMKSAAEELAYYEAYDARLTKSAANEAPATELRSAPYKALLADAQHRNGQAFRAALRERAAQEVAASRAAELDAAVLRSQDAVRGMWDADAITIPKADLLLILAALDR